MPQKTTKIKEESELSFEKALEELEEIVDCMEQGGLPLAELIDKAEKAKKLTLFCQKQLNILEGHVKVLADPAGQQPGTVWHDFDTSADGTEDAGIEDDTEKRDSADSTPTPDDEENHLFDSDDLLNYTVDKPTARKCGTRKK